MKKVNSNVNSVKETKTQEVKIMTKENLINGWRSPNETPVDGIELLLAIKSKERGSTFLIQFENIEVAKTLAYPDYELLGWQYCPKWSSDEKSNFKNGWRSMHDAPISSGSVLVAYRFNENRGDFTGIIEAKNFDKSFDDEGYAPIAWKCCPEWIEG